MKGGAEKRGYVEKLHYVNVLLRTALLVRSSVKGTRMGHAAVSEGAIGPVSQGRRGP